ncbi:alpha/beta hydrolase [Myroides sp. LJL119]
MKEQLFHYPNNSLFYKDQGKGECIVFLHGFLENSKIWDFYMDSLLVDHRTISIDLPGHGKSSSMPGPYHINDVADQIFELLQQLKLSKVSIVGHSMGGYIALAFGKLYPEFVKKLILVNSTAKADSNSKKIQRDRTIQLIKNNKDTFIQLAINNQFTPVSKKIFVHQIDRLLVQAKKIKEQDIIWALMAIKNRENHDIQLYNAPFPIIFILGKSDTIIDYNESCQHIEDTNTILFTLESGHMPYIEAKDELMQSLQAAVNL